jgi:hypothetical protein
MKVSSSISRAVLATIVAGAVVAPAAQAMPVHDSQSRGDCVMMARSCLTMDQVRQLDMHASTVVPQSPKGNDVVADVRGEASKPAPSTPAIPGLPVFPTDTTPIHAPKPAPVATDDGNGNGDFDWPLAGLVAAISVALGGAAFVTGRQLRAHATV